MPRKPKTPAPENPPTTETPTPDAAPAPAPPKAERKRTPRKAPPKTDDLPAATAPLSRYVAFATATVDRDQIKNAPYNPRVMDAAAEHRLEQEVKRGLVEPLVWNRRTGNLVGGHQRLGRLDDLHQGKPFAIPVAVVDVDEAEERRLNVALNSPDLMGKYDGEKFEALVREHLQLNPDLDVTVDYGLSAERLEAEVGLDPELYLPAEVEAAVVEAVEDAEEILKLKALRRQHKANDRAKEEKENARTLILALPPDLTLAETYARRRRLLSRLGLPPDQRDPVIAAWRVERGLGLEVVAGEEEEDEGGAGG